MSPARNSNIEYEMHFKCKLAETQSKPLSRIISYPHKLDSDLYEAERGDGSLPVLNWVMGGGFLWVVVIYLFVERALFILDCNKKPVTYSEQTVYVPLFNTTIVAFISIAKTQL